MTTKRSPMTIAIERIELSLMLEKFITNLKDINLKISNLRKVVQKTLDAQLLQKTKRELGMTGE